MNKNAKMFLENLLNTPSPSGFEEEASKKWEQYVGFADVSRDVYGNTVAKIGSGKKILLCGHIDEIGLMVKYISDEGYLYVSCVGGLNAETTTAQRVKIFNKNGIISGVFGSKPAHLTEDEEEPTYESVFIDIGARNKEDALRRVSVGDYVVFDISPIMLMNGNITARGLDNKAGAWVVAETLRRLKERNNFSCQVIGAATVQEENGAYGAEMLSASICPDICVVIDVYFASCSPDVEAIKFGECKLGLGPALFVGSVSHKGLLASMENIAGQNNIPIQKLISPGWSGTDADRLFNKNGGIPTTNIGIPNRYMHSPVEIVNIDDLDKCVELLVYFCEDI